MKLQVVTSFVLETVSLALVGCGDTKPAETTATNTPAQTPKALQTPSATSPGTEVEKAPFNSTATQPGSGSPMPGSGGMAPGMTPPMMGGGGGASTKMTAEEALASLPKAEPKYVEVQKKQDQSEAALKAKSTDATTKKAYVEQTYNYAHEVMTGQNALSPTTKYRAALALYRRVLKVDPTHAPSLEEKKRIDDIYVQMSRPIPE